MTDYVIRKVQYLSSYFVSIPPEYIDALNLKKGGDVVVSLKEDGSIVIKPLKIAE